MRKTISIILICSLAIICMATTCDDSTIENVDVYIRNQSDETIWINSYIFNDTTTLLEPGRSFQLQDPIELTIGDTYDDWVSVKMLERGLKYQVIIFKQSTLDKYTKEELIENNIYDKLYVLSFHDLIEFKGLVVYTGEE